MRLSLVVCTRNRAASLRRCLEAIQAMQKPGGFELVIVDNGSTDATGEVCRAFQRAAAFPVVIVDEPTSGLARARNRGWKTATGEIVTFTDDDCYVAPDYAASVLAFFQANPEASYFGGRVTLYDPDDYPITILTSVEPRWFPPRTFIKAGDIHGANFGFRRDALSMLGGFDQALGAGAKIPSGEDIEMIGRLSAMGGAGGYCPAITVAHHHGRKADDAVALYRGYDLGRGAYYASMLRTPLRWQALGAWIRGPSIKRPGKMLGEMRGALTFLAAHFT